jgi:hypothetical protein
MIGDVGGGGSGPPRILAFILDSLMRMRTRVFMTVFMYINT